MSTPTPEEAVDRGDLLEDEVKTEVKTDVKEDPEVKKLETELKVDPELDLGAEDPKKKDSRVPLARHEAVLQKEREKRADLERQLAQYQQGGQIANVNEEITALENSVIKMEKEYAVLLSDGEVDKATAVMAQIRRSERDMAEAKSDMKIHAAEIRATERVRYSTALERIEASFPTLNQDHGDYDQEVAQEVIELKEAYQMKGMTPTMALQKAVKILIEPRTTRQELATSATPRVDAGAERKKEAVAKTAGATGRTPPSMNRAGVDSDKHGGGSSEAAAVIKMSQKDFAALSEAALAKLRGDEL